MHLLNVQDDPGKFYYTVAWLIMEKVHSQKVSIRRNSDFQKRLFDRVDTNECQEMRLFVNSVQQATMRLQKTGI